MSSCLKWGARSALLQPESRSLWRTCGCRSPLTGLPAIRSATGRKTQNLLVGDCFFSAMTIRCGVRFSPVPQKQEADGPIPGWLCRSRTVGDNRHEWLLLLWWAKSCWPDQLERRGGGGESFTFSDVTLTSHGGGAEILWKIQLQNTINHSFSSNSNLFIYLFI